MGPCKLWKHAQDTQLEIRQGCSRCYCKSTSPVESTDDEDLCLLEDCDYCPAYRSWKKEQRDKTVEKQQTSRENARNKAYQDAKDARDEEKKRNQDDKMQTKEDAFKGKQAEKD